MRYTVGVKGAPPPDLAHKIASAHAEAVARQSASEVAIRGPVPPDIAAKLAAAQAAAAKAALVKLGSESAQGKAGN